MPGLATETRPQPCRSCGQAMVWAITASGRLMPLDADPVADGNLAARRDSNSGTLHVRGLAGGEHPHDGERRARSHFASCPRADAHRKAKPR